MESTTLLSQLAGCCLLLLVYTCEAAAHTPSLPLLSPSLCRRCSVVASRSERRTAKPAPAAAAHTSSDT